MAKTKARRDAGEDEVAFHANGTMTLKTGGEVHKLRRPTVGELRRFADVMNEIGDDDKALRGMVEAAQTAWDTQEPATRENLRPPNYDAATSGIHARMFDWWRTVVDELDTNGGQLPTGEDEADRNDDMPPWLVDVALINETFKVWRSVPWAGGTSPTERTQAAQIEMAQKMAPALSAAGPALTAMLGNGSATPSATMRSGSGPS